MKIRITGAGIYGLPISAEAPHGEYPIGHIMDIGENEPPAGWAGKYEVVTGKPAPEAVAVTNDDEGDEKPVRRGRPPKNG